MGVAENLAAVRAFYGAGPADDDRDRHSYADPGIVWHVPGANRVSGRYEGREEVFERMPALMQPLDEWSIDLEALFANDDLVVATVSIAARRKEHRVECGGAHVFRLDPDARITEAWGFVADQEGLDRLFDS